MSELVGKKLRVREGVTMGPIEKEAGDEFVVTEHMAERFDVDGWAPEDGHGPCELVTKAAASKPATSQPAVAATAPSKSTAS